MIVCTAAGTNDPTSAFMRTVLPACLARALLRPGCRLTNPTASCTASSLRTAPVPCQMLLAARSASKMSVGQARAWPSAPPTLPLTAPPTAPRQACHSSQCTQPLAQLQVGSWRTRERRGWYTYIPRWAKIRPFVTLAFGAPHRPHIFSLFQRQGLLGLPGFSSASRSPPPPDPFAGPARCQL